MFPRANPLATSRNYDILTRYTRTRLPRHEWMKLKRQLPHAHPKQERHAKDHQRGPMLLTLLALIQLTYLKQDPLHHRQNASSFCMRCWFFIAFFVFLLQCLLSLSTTTTNNGEMTHTLWVSWTLMPCNASAGDLFLFSKMVLCYMDLTFVGAFCRRKLHTTLSTSHADVW